MMRKSLLLLLLLHHPGYAFDWDNLWARPDQQGAKLLSQGKPAEAVNKFEDPAWQATANYRAGHYDKAALLFNHFNAADGFYNRGNALAHLGRLENAIKSYEKSLNMDPNHEDAKHNLALLKQLQKQEKDKQKDQNQASQQQKTNQQNQQRSTQNKDQDKPNPQSPQDNHHKQGGQPQTQQADAQQQQLEKNQAHEQMLRRVPDNPGGLLKQKFKRDHLKRKQGKWPS